MVLILLVFKTTPDNGTFKFRGTVGIFLDLFGVKITTDLRNACMQIVESFDLVGKSFGISTFLTRSTRSSPLLQSDIRTEEIERGGSSISTRLDDTISSLSHVRTGKLDEKVH